MSYESNSYIISLILLAVLSFVLLGLFDMIYHRIRFHWSFSRYLNDNSRIYFEKEFYDFIKELRSK